MSGVDDITADYGIAIVLCWCQEALNRWHLPRKVWRELEVDLELAHERFMGDAANTPEQEEAIKRLWALMHDPQDGSAETGAWAAYYVPGKQKDVNQLVARYYLTGADPC